MAPADSLFSIDVCCCILYFLFLFYIFICLLCLKRLEWEGCSGTRMGVGIQFIRKRSGITSATTLFPFDSITIMHNYPDLISG